MNRRTFLSTLAAGSLAGAAAKDAPNFLFLMADQFRADALAIGGNDFVATPHLDALARGGVRFSNAYCPQALCTPSRASLLTGVYPHTTRLDHNLYKVENAFRMPEFRLEPNWPTLLRQAGWFSGYIGKWHLGETNPGMFDYWNGYNSLMPHWLGKRDSSAYRSDVETDDAIAFLERNRGKRFMLFVSYYPPHTPYDPPSRYREPYAAKGVPHPDYYGAVTAVDADLGRLLAKVEALGLASNTFVSFTADHGETFGTRLGSTNKTVSYDDSAKVPLLIRWPGHVPAGVEYRGGVTTLDLMPTMLEAAGLARPERLQGRSRLREMRDRNTGWKQPVFLENITQKAVDGEPLIERAVRTERWKLILRRKPQNELYDLASDPGERKDLFPDPGSASVVKQHARLLLDWGKRTRDSVAVELAGNLV